MNDPRHFGPPARRLHAPFLERAGEPVDQEVSSLALGAFLTLRAVDQLTTPHPTPDALEYQVNALDSFLADVDTDAPELPHLKSVAEGLRKAARGSHECLWDPMAAFCGWLEGEFRLEEALDVIETAVITAEAHGPMAVAGLKLQRARVLRRSGRFDEAIEAYANAGREAAAQGQGHEELLSRIGRGIVLQQIGNLPAAEEMLTAARDAATACGDREAEARANHDLAVTHFHQRRPEDAVPLAYRAFQMYETEELRYRALGDLGQALSALGHLAAARDAQELIVNGPTSTGMRATALIELLGIATDMHDRMSFERIRRQIDSIQSTLPPDWSIDYHIKLGVGLAAFGQTRTGRSYLKRAVDEADRHGLNEYLFRAEDRIRQLEAQDQAPSTPTPEFTSYDYPEVEQVAVELHALRMT